MAKGRYQKLYEARMKRLGKDKSTEDDLQSQVNNLKARLEAGGVKNPEADDRNALEKWLNLEQDQGIIGDVFELLERPFQAIKTGITSAQEGDSALKGAWEGLSGQKDTEFKEVLMNTGGFEDEKGKIDLVDVLGTAGDIFLDPMDIPVAGFGKVGKALDAGDNVFKAMRNADSVNDLLFKAGGKAIKGGAKIADTGIEKGLKYLDETKGVKAYDKHGNLLSENAKLLYGNADAKRATELMPQLAKGQSFAGKVAKPAQGRLETYKKLKNDFTDIFKKSQASINAVIAGRNAETTANTVKTKISKIAKQNEDKVANYAAGVGKTADEVAEDVTLFVESMMDRNISKDDLLKVARKGNLAANDNVLNALETMKSQLPEELQKGLDLSVTVKPNGYIQLGSGWNKQVLAENGVPSFNELDEANKMINYGNWYTDEDLAKIEELKNDQDFRQLVNELVGEVKDGDVIATIGKDLVDNANKMLDEAFGTNLNAKYANNSGYLPHTIADENMLKDAKETGAPIIKGKTSSLKERTRLGSMRENNRLYEKSLTGEGATKTTKAFFKKYPKLFEENFNKAFTNKYYNDLTNLGKQNKIINDVLIEQTFGSRKEIENLQKQIKKYSLSGDKEKLAEVTSKYNKLTENSTIKYLTKYDSKVPNGFTRITPEHAKDISKKLKKIQNTMGVSDEKFNDLIKLFSNKDGSIAINNDVLRMLEFAVDEKGKNGILKTYDKWLDFFKSTKTLSVTNVMNNLVGNTHNLYLSGIDMLDQARFFPKAIEAVKNGPQLYARKISGEVLTGKESEIANLWEIFVKTGFGGDEIALDMQDLPDFMKDIVLKGKTNKKFTAKDIATFLPKLNMKTNVFMDNTSRFVVMLKAMEDPSYLSKLGIEGATDIEKYQKVISKVMFDPAMMTDVEKNVLKRIIPFYTYTKNNLVFQVDNLGRNGSRYARTMKAIKSLQKGATGDNEEYMADYIKNSLYIPIPGLDENGNYTVLRTTLPFGQLIEMTDNPIKELAEMSGPLFKSAYEYGTGIDTFTGREIESFPGEKSKQLPFLTKKQQKFIGDFSGFDAPLKSGYRLLTDPMSTITMQNNVDTDKISKMYDEIDELKNMMKQYEQEGYQFSTMTELKKANKNHTVAGINAIFAKYGIDQETYAERKYGQ